MATKTVKLTISSAGTDIVGFQIRDQSGTVIGTATKAELLAGKNFTVDNSVTSLHAVDTGTCGSQAMVMYTDGTTKYYNLDCCNVAPGAKTKLTPLIANQRYVDPVAGGVFYTWDGTYIEQDADLPAPSGWNGNIQRVTGSAGCP